MTYLAKALEDLEQANIESFAWIQLVDQGLTGQWRSIALLQWDADDGNEQAKTVLELLKVEIVKRRMLR